MSLKFNADRWGKWVSASMAWGRNDPSGVTFTRIQGFGVIDAELYDVNASEVKNKVDEFTTVYDHINIKSYLWVIGVYEFFRMADQKIGENSDIANEKASKAIKHCKQEFARLRMPLAKFEASNKYANMDYDVPHLGANGEQLGWQINDNEIIYYRYLSDLALDTLNQLRLSNYEKNDLSKTS
ncbi:MAG TPA: hypothetical protein VKG26_06820 [Bacteroidia bacterium]|nr:hypothetical protein [Bacteroidia bacterium]